MGAAILDTYNGKRHQNCLDRSDSFFQKFYSAMGWELTEPFVELKEQLERVRTEADVIIVLSHLGIHDDERMAADFPEIDVILGAHTHHILHQGKLINDTLLCGAGKYGFLLGRWK